MSSAASYVGLDDALALVSVQDEPVLLLDASLTKNNPHLLLCVRCSRLTMRVAVASGSPTSEGRCARRARPRGTASDDCATAQSTTPALRQGGRSQPAPGPRVSAGAEPRLLQSHWPPRLVTSANHPSRRQPRSRMGTRCRPRWGTARAARGRSSMTTRCAGATGSPTQSPPRPLSAASCARRCTSPAAAAVTRPRGPSIGRSLLCSQQQRQPAMVLVVQLESSRLAAPGRSRCRPWRSGTRRCGAAWGRG